jgi:glycosyltransferase involved in cell wall biosynthesis
MPNILYIANSGSVFGGGQISLLNLLDGLDRSVFNPVVVCPENKGLAQALAAIGIEPMAIALPSLRTLRVWRWTKAIRQLMGIVKMGQVDCIHSNGSRSALYGGVVARLTGVPLVAHFRTFPSDGIVDRIIAILASKIVVVSKSAAQRFAWLPDRKKTLIYNGVNTQRFRPDSAAGFKRSDFGLQETDTVIGVVGRLSPEKGLHVLLEAMALIEQPPETLWLIIIGVGQTTYTTELHNIVRQKKLHNVIFTGFLPAPEKIYPLIDIFCLCSFTEAFNRSLLEAMACGIPAIASRVGGNPEAVVENQTGLLVPPNDAVNLARAISELVREKKKRWQMGRKARFRVVQKFNIANNVQQTQDLYLQLLWKRSENARAARLS